MTRSPSATWTFFTVASNGETSEVSPREVAMCAEQKIDLKTYAARKAATKRGQVQP